MKRLSTIHQLEAVSLPPPSHLELLRRTVAALVGEPGTDLSLRQISIFLNCYLTDGPHTVRGLSDVLGVSRPAVTRSVDRLAQLRLARRAPDPLDKRSVVIEQTPGGAAFLVRLRAILAEKL